MESVYARSDVGDSYGHKSPQVETVEDEGYGKSILEYQFGEPEHVTWPVPSADHNLRESSTASPSSQARRQSSNRKELSSILKKPSKRPTFSYAQIEALMATWEVTESPPAAQVLELVHITGLTVPQVRRWFSNKRRPTNNGGNNNGAREKVAESFSPNAPDPEGMNNNYVGAMTIQCSYSFDYATDSSFSSTSRSNGIPAGKYTKEDKRDRRLEGVKRIPHSELEECLEISRARMSQLILLYMKKKLDMRRTLLRETTKLKEMIRINPFSTNQMNAIKLWRDNFFLELGQELDEDKRQKMSWVKSNVAEVWHPVVVYGKLCKISLETAIKDLSPQNGSNRQSIGCSDELTVPGILRYLESHFLSKD